MKTMYEWMHDDITWCRNECSHTECERNLANKLLKTGIFSMSMFKGTDMCPFYNNFSTINKEKIESESSDE